MIDADPRLAVTWWSDEKGKYQWFEMPDGLIYSYGTPHGTPHNWQSENVTRAFMDGSSAFKRIPSPPAERVTAWDVSEGL